MLNFNRIFSIMNREDKIKIAIEKGYTYNKENGKIYNNLNEELITKSTDGYLRISLRIDKKVIHIFGHQFAWYWIYNEIVKCIDHINEIKTDNRILNLRSVTHQENSFNQTKPKGYTWDKINNKWESKITVNGKKIHLGRFDLEEDAKNAYLEAKKKYHKINE